MARTYGCILRFSAPGGTQQVHYELVFACTYGKEGGYQFRIDRKQVYINDKPPKTLLDTLADQCGKVLYPLLVQTDAQGQIQEIVNLNEVRQRWESVHPELLRYYQGGIASGMIQEMEDAVIQEQRIVDVISTDWPWSLLQAAIRCPYKSYQARATLALPVLPYLMPVRYDVQLRLVTELTRSGLLQIEATGTCKDTRSLEDILKGNPLPVFKTIHPEGTLPEGSVQFTFKAYPHNGTLFSVVGVCSLMTPDGEKKVSVEMYQQGAGSPAPATRKSPPTLLPETPAGAPKGWSPLF